MTITDQTEQNAAPNLDDEQWQQLLLLGALEGKVVIGSMNRGGLDGASWTMDDRFTGCDAASIAASRLEGGKMLLRIDDEDDGSLTLRAAHPESGR